MYEEAYEGFRKNLGQTNPETLKAQNLLGLFYVRLGLRTGRRELGARAENLLKAVLDVRRREFPPDHLDTLQSANDLGGALVLWGRLDEAEPLLKEAIAGRRKNLGPGNVDTLGAEMNYIQLLNRRQKRAEAVAECRAPWPLPKRMATANINRQSPFSVRWSRCSRWTGRRMPWNQRSEPWF